MVMRNRLADWPSHPQTTPPQIEIIKSRLTEHVVELTKCGLQRYKSAAGITFIHR